MQCNFERNVNSCKMCIHSEIKPDFAMRMVSENSINGLIPLDVCELNNETIYSYKITSLISITDYFEKQELHDQDIETMLMSMNKMLDSLDEYLLNENAIILDPDKIFININENKWCFIYYGENDEVFENGMKTLAEFLIQHVCHKDNFAVTIVYGIYKKSISGNTSPRQFLEYEIQKKDLYDGIIETKKKINEDIIPEIITEETEEPDKIKLYALYSAGAVLCIAILTGLIGTLFPSVRPVWINNYACIGGIILGGTGLFLGYRWYKENKHLFIKIHKQNKQLPYESEKVITVVPSPDNKEMTVLLNDYDVNDSHEITWRECGQMQKYKITEDVVVIGSSNDRADCVMEIPGVSRMHARISREGSSYFIKDLNSTNGTKLNGKELACFEMCEIHTNDRFVLGNVECVFI